MNKIEKSIKFLNLIDSFGYEGYIVGGAVRDYLLGMPIYDIDITTLKTAIDTTFTHRNSQEYLEKFKTKIAR